MTTKTVILLSGYLGSGKDTVGAYLSPYGFKRYAFADTLKDEVSNMYRLDRADMDTQTGKQKLIRDGLTVRGLLISHGQMRRAENIDYWVAQIADKIKGNDDRCVVVTDWRFPNEYAFLLRSLDKSWNVVPVRVNRWAVPPLVDVSELALDSFPFAHFIDNSCDVEELSAKIDSFIWSLDSIRWLIIDVDDVLLDWIDGFARYLAHLGVKTSSRYPTTWNLSEWIKTEDYTNMDVEALVLKFNSTQDFAALPPVKDAHNLLAEARRLRLTTVAVTTCSDDKLISKKRAENLASCFPGLIAKVICLPLNASKKKVYTQFKCENSIVVDDKACHVLSAAEVGLTAVLFKRTWADVESLPKDTEVMQARDHLELKAILQRCFL